MLGHGRVEFKLHFASYWAVNHSPLKDVMLMKPRYAFDRAT